MATPPNFSGKANASSPKAPPTAIALDCQHRLIGVSLPGGSVASYKYDAFGRRIEKTVDGHTTE
ncbi:Rhs family protein, partial [Pseudomonas syringae pv. actinidiae ICMP 18883]